MTPYLVNTTWVDLDQIQAVADKPDSWGINYFGSVTLAFRDKPLSIWLCEGVLSFDSGDAVWTDNGRASAIWNAFIAAWKARSNQAPQPASQEARAAAEQGT